LVLVSDEGRTIRLGETDVIEALRRAGLLPKDDKDAQTP
jgi:hypothetical protein